MTMETVGELQDAVDDLTADLVAARNEVVDLTGQVADLTEERDSMKERLFEMTTLATDQHDMIEAIESAADILDGAGRRASALNDRAGRLL